MNIETQSEATPLTSPSDASLHPAAAPSLVLIFIQAIRANRLFIVVTTGITTLIALVVSFLLPVWYLSSAVIMVSPQDDFMGLGKLLGGNLAEGILGGKKVSDEIDRYEAIFKSERLRLELIDKFELRRVYELDDPSIKEPVKLSLKKLGEDISFKDNKNGTITISALFKEDSVKAAEMANHIVTLLDSINRELLTESARYQRRFIGRRFEQAMDDLRDAEDSLNRFQKRFKIGEIKEQMKASIETSAQIEALAVQSEVEYNLQRKLLGDSHPVVLQAQNRSIELRNQSRKFETGGLNSEVIIPFSKMPDVGLEFVRLTRQIVMNQKIVEFLITQYEQAKIQEAKDTPSILVLDKARVPEWKEKPKRLFIVAGGMMFGLMFSLIIIVLRIELQKASNQELQRLVISLFTRS